MRFIAPNYYEQVWFIKYFTLRVDKAFILTPNMPDKEKEKCHLSRKFYYTHTHTHTHTDTHTHAIEAQ